MGVHGLTTYLREKKRVLSTTTVVSSSSPKCSIPIVVDGWSFIYDLYQHSNLPWVYGGEYPEFVKLVKFSVESWFTVGFQVNFVFDGPRPNIKFATVLSRMGQSRILPSQLFFRTSKTSRSTGRFLNENRVIPPLLYSTCVRTLLELKATFEQLDIHFADEEGDPYAVELAGRLGGYVVGNDSDFVILNSDRYKGYIPLDELVWQTPQKDVTPENDDGDDEFQTVRKPKGKKNRYTHQQNSVGLIPLEQSEHLSLSFASYCPETLAKHLNLPVTLLPLLAALVGNDFSKEHEIRYRKMQTLFFEKSLSSSQRIEKVAATLRSAISPNSQHLKAKRQVGSVMDLIDRTVNVLLSRAIGTLGSGEVEGIIETVVSSTLQYAIAKNENTPGREGLWPTSVCALHDPEACTMLPMISHNVMQQAEQSSQADPNLLEAREHYLDAYRNGYLNPKMLDILNTGTSWPSLFLENPDLETVARSIGKPIREWIYAILHDTVGLPVPEPENNSTTTHDDQPMEQESDDELIDVVESNSEDEDFLAPLKGELHRLHPRRGADSDQEDEESASEPPASIISHRHLSSKPPIVTDYIRRGSRMTAEAITTYPLADILSSINLGAYADDNAPPIVLRTEEERFTVLLRILKSDFPAMHTMAPDDITMVLAVRWIVSTLHTRWQETESREREMERWTKNEARLSLLSFQWAPDNAELNDGLVEPIKNSFAPVLEDRNIQITAQLLMALESIEQLSESLLLLKRVPGVSHNLSGKAFHALLTGTVADRELTHGLWEAVETNLSLAFQEERSRKSKKSKTKMPAVVSIPSLTHKTSSKSKSLFAVLGDLEA